MFYVNFVQMKTFQTYKWPWINFNNYNSHATDSYDVNVHHRNQSEILKSGCYRIISQAFTLSVANRDTTYTSKLSISTSLRYFCLMQFSEWHQEDNRPTKRRNQTQI